MSAIFAIYALLVDRLERADWLVPTLARLLFAAVLLVYFLNSGLTKLGDGISGLWTPSVGAYAQIFPRVLEAAGYDTDALSIFHKLVVVAGTWAEFILPVLIVLGLLTRLAALGMIGFVVIQSLTDIYGHSATDALGAWFDRFPDAIILDQRSLWVFLLVVLVIKGAGPLSFDRALTPKKG
ncbi:DoxX family protein [Sulfitobacter sp. M57]|uniref:DoxX family protein n=1 Tax=unclassified Sulfitobacter TaxID=196795 RepID=UPI0023E13A9A|nr:MULTISPECIES: DoxX family protein [unclassified Sulfitobacter]MDF3414279.1 DoxX family protein [Sulfitobacter sp. KE5]MDF3420439.1 DoxX family protein [Sulfitobacter sp. KE43]MDF3432825.1 DoxX family protein [Sulfitobacter sp. KE42]MDF3458465.1 DoxX family protein [Sulfitobacter sp. S74]MDF3462365.1 DoxX family protein [Sulfitobacter sp. Ks18]